MDVANLCLGALSCLSAGMKTEFACGTRNITASSAQAPSYEDIRADAVDLPLQAGICDPLSGGVFSDLCLLFNQPRR